MILAIWEREPPYDIDLPGNRFRVTTAATRIPEIHRRRAHTQALPEAAAGNRRHRGRAVVQGRDRHGRARLPSAFGELPPFAVAAQPLGQLRRGQDATPACKPTPPTGASPAPSSSPTTTRWRPATGATIPNEPLPLLLAHDGKEDALLRSPDRVQDRTRAGRRHAHRRLPGRTPRPLRHGEQAWSTRSSPCARKWASSARSSTPAWTGWIRSSPGARWS